MTLTLPPTAIILRLADKAAERKRDQARVIGPNSTMERLEHIESTYRLAAAQAESEKSNA